MPLRNFLTFLVLLLFCVTNTFAQGANPLLPDSETALDLGGVTARLFWLGPAHTKGDEMIFVQPDSALITGDIVEKNLAPNIPGAEGSPKSWLAIVDKIALLKPRYVVPDHGEL